MKSEQGELSGDRRKGRPSIETLNIDVEPTARARREGDERRLREGAAKLVGGSPEETQTQEGIERVPGRILRARATDRQSDQDPVGGLLLAVATTGGDGR
jgi:hypothetical protein